MPVLAHPYRNFGGKKGRQDRESVERKIRELFDAGIRGVDVFSGNSNNEELNHLIGLCDELNLVPIIGSDFHYTGKGLNPKQLQTIDEKLLKRIEEWVRNGTAKTS